LEEIGTPPEQLVIEKVAEKGVGGAAGLALSAFGKYICPILQQVRQFVEAI